MNEEQVRKAADALAHAVEMCLRRWDDGYQPTFGQIDHLRSCVFPFLNDNMCGHRIVEDCDCASHP
jgi:hypothetical protein